MAMKPKYKQTFAWKYYGTRYKDLDEWQKREYLRERKKISRERKLEQEFQIWKETKKEQ